MFQILADECELKHIASDLNDFQQLGKLFKSEDKRNKMDKTG